ncbi:MAG TPA: hypothetical protein VMX14_13475 [Anaerolineae bacterium]|nr:hypothetical protein [Anaerolineae bacterium]
MTHAATLEITIPQLAALLGISLTITDVEVDPMTGTVTVTFNDPRLVMVPEGATPPKINFDDLTSLATRGELRPPKKPQPPKPPLHKSAYHPEPSYATQMRTGRLLAWPWRDESVHT